MNGLEFIKSKQQNWAKRKGFELAGGTIPNKGEKNYLSDLANNLFEPLTEENVKRFDSGDGNCYFYNAEKKNPEKVLAAYAEEYHLGLWVTGNNYTDQKQSPRS